MQGHKENEAAEAGSAFNGAPSAMTTKEEAKLEANARAVPGGEDVGDQGFRRI